MKCMIKGCSSNYSNKKNEDKVKLFSFPKDPKIKEKWSKICGIGPDNYIKARKFSNYPQF